METLAQFDKRQKTRIRRTTIIFCCLFVIIFIGITQLKFGSVQSASMLPILKVGGSVIYRPSSNFYRLKQGDIILYEDANKRLIIHRIIRINGYIDNNGKYQVQYIVKGDNNRYEDTTPVTKNNYRGRVVYIVQSDLINSYMHAMSSSDNKEYSIAIAFTLLVYAIFICLGFLLIYIKNKNMQKRRQILEVYWQKENRRAQEALWLNSREIKHGLSDLKTILNNNYDLHEKDYDSIIELLENDFKEEETEQEQN